MKTSILILASLLVVGCGTGNGSPAPAAPTFAASSEPAVPPAQTEVDGNKPFAQRGEK